MKRDRQDSGVSPYPSLVTRRASLLPETVRQAGLLFSAQTGSMIAGFAASLVMARWMEPAEFGRFVFCQSFVVIAGLFFEFGIFSAGARVLALTKGEEEERRALGALVLLALGVGVIFSLFVAAAALPVGAIFRQDVRGLLLWAAIPALFHPAQLLVELSCQGLNRIRHLSLFQLLNSSSYLLMLVGLATSHRLGATTALAAYLTAIGLAAVWTISRLRPRFADASHYVGVTLKEARGYGLNLYLARITGTASARLDNLIIAYFLGRAGAGLDALGFYGFAQKLINPIVNLPRAVAITRFRAFAKLERVPARITRWNAVLLMAAVSLFVTVGPLALRLLFPKYGGAAPLLLPFALWALFVGLFQPYNAFLSSQGRGRELRNIALIVTVCSLAGLLIFVPLFGVHGAAWAGAAAMALDYGLHLYYYQRFQKSGVRS